MPKRKIDPATGEPELTYREQRLVDEFVKNGGNGSEAAQSAGYGSARPDQSDYQVLRRPEVQRLIQQRIAESRVSADEIRGTLAAFMRASPAGFFDQEGNFSIEAAKQNGVDHLLKSIAITTREIPATRNRPATVVRTYRATFHSPIQAAVALARMLGIGRRQLDPKTSIASDNIHRDFDPLTLLDDIINDQIRQTGLPRSAVADNLVQVRPEIAKYIKDLEEAQTPGPFDHLSLKDTARNLCLILDLLTDLRQGAPAPEPDLPEPDSSSRTHFPD